MELIDKKVIITKIKSWIKDCDDAEDYGTSQSFEDVICLIEDIPTTDGLVHAKWKDVRYGIFGVILGCSNCASEDEYGMFYDYCPRCGAVMDLKED